MSKKLVAYFSASGITARAAKKLADLTNADLYEIKPAKTDTQADLNWMDKKSRSSLEMNDFTSRPALADKDADIASYDTIILFATSGGSEFGKTVHELASSCPGATIREGRLFNGNLSDDVIKKWVEA